MNKLKILFIEPFYGGSHRNFTDGLIATSKHDYTLYTLPARFWKWRMRGAALYFSELIKNPADFDLLFTSELMSLSDLKMLWGGQCPPAVVYFHENQLSYPLPEGEKMDYQFGFTDITTALAADHVLFNSRYHLETFIEQMPSFIGKMPEYKPAWIVDKIKKKASVIYPGCSFPPQQPQYKKDSVSGLPPLIVWNHRWEFDKCPDTFFSVLEKVDTYFKNQGTEVPFNLCLLGENFQKKPKAFISAKTKWGNRILQYGYCEDRSQYFSWLERSDIVISTAIQENFGIAIAEAVKYGCIPLLPNRLSYPELVPESYHPDVLYNDETDLAEKLVAIISALIKVEGQMGLKNLFESFSGFSWEKTVLKFDYFFSAQV